MSQECVPGHQWAVYLRSGPPDAVYLNGVLHAIHPRKPPPPPPPHRSRSLVHPASRHPPTHQPHGNKVLGCIPHAAHKDALWQACKVAESSIQAAVHNHRPQLIIFAQRVVCQHAARRSLRCRRHLHMTLSFHWETIQHVFAGAARCSGDL